MGERCHSCAKTESIQLSARVRVRDDKKIFNTTKNTVITLNNDTKLNNVESIETSVESQGKSINIAKIEFIEEFSVSKACLKCKKHIIQWNSQYLLKCDFCNYMMRQKAVNRLF